MNQDNYEFLYPHHDDPMFNYKIAQRKEFQDTMYEGKIFNVEEEANLLCTVFCLLSLNRFKLNEFETTETELNAIAAPAIIGLRRPIAAKGIPTEL